jgi:hypothetical protein
MEEIKNRFEMKAWRDGAMWTIHDCINDLYRRCANYEEAKMFTENLNKTGRIDLVRGEWEKLDVLCK